MSLVTPAVNTQISSILLATDFSPASEKPLRHALAIARYYHARLSVLNVVSALGFTLAGPGCVAAATQAASRDARQLQDSLAARGALEGLQFQTIVRDGGIAEELQKVVRQEHVDLVVIGTHSRHGIGKLLFGSVAEQIFRRTLCPVLTVGPGSFPDSTISPSDRPMRPFLFATDFGPASLHALSYAIAYANDFRTRLALLHVVPEVPLPEGSRWCTAGDVEKMRAAACEEGHCRLKSLIRERLVCEPDYRVVFGPPAEGVLKTAEEIGAGVVIMGLNTTNHVGTAAHLLWATAYEVVCRARCPVLTIRH